MNEVLVSDANQSSDPERKILLVAYVLHIMAPFTLWLAAIAGVIIDHLKVNETHNQFIRSHHRWLIRTFWWGLLWLVIATVLKLILVGFLMFLVVAIWWLYRVIRGVLNYVDRKPMPVD